MRLRIGIITFFSFCSFVTLAAFEAAAVPKGDACREFLIAASGYVKQHLFDEFVKIIGHEKVKTRSWITDIEVSRTVWAHGNDSARMLLQTRKILECLSGFSEEGRSIDFWQEIMRPSFTEWDYVHWRRNAYALFFGRRSTVKLLGGTAEKIARIRSFCFDQKAINEWCVRESGGDTKKHRMCHELVRTVCLIDIERFVLDLLPSLSLWHELSQEAYGIVEERYSICQYWQPSSSPEADRGFNQFQKYVFDVCKDGLFKSERLAGITTLVALRQAQEAGKNELESVRAADKDFKSKNKDAFEAATSGMLRLRCSGLSVQEVGELSEALFNQDKVAAERAHYFAHIAPLHIRHYKAILERVIIHKLCEAAQAGAHDTFNKIAAHYDMPIRIGTSTGIAAKLSKRIPLIRSLQRSLQARLLRGYYDVAPLTTDQLIEHFSQKGGRLSSDEQLLLLLGLVTDAHYQRKLLSEVIRDTPLARAYFESLHLGSGLLHKLAKQKDENKQILIGLLEEWVTGNSDTLTPDDFAAILREDESEPTVMISAECFPPGKPLPTIEEDSDEDADGENYTKEEFDALDSYRQAYLQHHLYTLGEEIVFGLIFESEAHTLPPSRVARSPRRGSDEASAGAGSLSSELIKSSGKQKLPKNKSGKSKKRNNKKRRKRK